jgi:hypothetical protein
MVRDKTAACFVPVMALEEKEVTILGKVAL